MTGTPPVTVALSGATGFTGGAVARTLAHRGYRVRALTRRPPIAYHELVGVEWIHGEVTDPAALDTLVAGADSCFHIAAKGRTAARRFIHCHVGFFKHRRPFTIAKARRLPGYEPRVGLVEGFRRTVAWYRREGLLR